MQEAIEVKKFVAEGKNPADIYQEASKAAQEAVTAFVEKHGEPMYCGFGHVNIVPARGSFVSWCKKMDIGSNAYRGGWDISYYKFMEGHANSHTQSLDLKEIACDAFANVLKQHGMTAYGIGRAD